jgi:hypothetical protein
MDRAKRLYGRSEVIYAEHWIGRRLNITAHGHPLMHRNDNRFSAGFYLLANFSAEAARAPESQTVGTLQNQVVEFLSRYISLTTSCAFIGWCLPWNSYMMNEFVARKRQSQRQSGLE